jgi:hypothetical protein
MFLFMDHLPDQTPPKKRSLLSQNRLIVIGALLIWVASIGLALQLKNLLTPSNYPVGTDPSFDMSVAAFCILAVILGGLLLWHGIAEREKRMEARLEKLINTATIFICMLLVINFLSGVLLFSANRSFAASYTPLLRDEPAPDDAMPTFAVPIAAKPTPTFDPTSKFMAGPVKSAFSGLRVGDIWISLTPSRDTVRFVQVYMDRIQCNVQDGLTSGFFAVGKSEQLISGPFQILGDRTFFGAQDMAVIHGIIGTLDQGYGTVYLHYKDPTTNRTCDLGSFDWTATLTGN